MGLEETHLDVLQNIEFAITRVDRDHDDVSDYTVMEALDALILIYREEFRGHAPKLISLDGVERRIFEDVKAVCEWRIDRAEAPFHMPVLSVEATSLEEILACLRRIRKSVDLWHRQGGRRGYLEFVSHYIR
jgi:hypothetical protein